MHSDRKFKNSTYDLVIVFLHACNFSFYRSDIFPVVLSFECGAHLARLFSFCSYHEGVEGKFVD